MASTAKPKKAKKRRAARIAALKRKGVGPKVAAKIANGKKRS